MDSLNRNPLKQFFLKMKYIYTKIIVTTKNNEIFIKTFINIICDKLNKHRIPTSVCSLIVKQVVNDKIIRKDSNGVMEKSVDI